MAVTDAGVEGAETRAHGLLRMVAPVWSLWALALVLTVVLGLAAGAHEPPSPWRHDELAWPGLSWDFSWYWALAHDGYPSMPHAAYAFFPLWPVTLRMLDSVG